MKLAELSKLGGADRDLDSGSRPARPLGSWVLDTVASLAQSTGQELRTRLEVEGGSAQEGDDITAQPLKDELFPPALQLSSASGCSEGRGPQAALPDAGSWRREQQRCPCSHSGQGRCRAGAGPAPSPVLGGQVSPAWSEGGRWVSQGSLGSRRVWGKFSSFPGRDK